MAGRPTPRDPAIPAPSAAAAAAAAATTSDPFVGVKSPALSADESLQASRPAVSGLMPAAERRDTAYGSQSGASLRQTVPAGAKDRDVAPVEPLSEIKRRLIAGLSGY